MSNLVNKTEVVGTAFQANENLEIKVELSKILNTAHMLDGKIHVTFFIDETNKKQKKFPCFIAKD